MKDNDFDTSELLSSLDKLKAKYSFNFEDEDTTPEVKDEPVEEVEETLAVSEEVEAAESVIVDEAPVVEAAVEDAVIEKEEPAANDMSWLIDSNETSDAETDPEAEPAPIIVPDVVEEKSVEVEAEPEAEEDDEPVVVAEPVTEVPATAWYLDPVDTEEETEEAEADEVEEISAVEEVEEAEEVESVEADDDEEEDEFADLDDDDELVVIRGNAPKQEENKEESPFFTAFKENVASDDKKVKPPKPVKSPKPAKPVKEPKEPKEKKEKKPANPKRKKLILNIVISVALVIALWACLFVTDILLVSNWSAPVFCAESEVYEDGSKTYTGAFYQIQISVNDDGSVSRVSLPWFAKGPNGEK